MNEHEPTVSPEPAAGENALLIDPEEYLKKVKEETVVTEEILQESLNRLNVPLQKVGYQESGAVSVDTDTVKFDFSNLDRKQVNSFMVPGPHAANAEQIRRERSASAFAFKLINPVLKNDQLKNDVRNFLKYFALAGYNCSARSTFEYVEVNQQIQQKEYNRAMGDWEVEEEEIERMALSYDFLEWKKTEAYKGWKDKEENKKLKDYEEFDPWNEWVKNTGYDYKKDLH